MARSLPCLPSRREASPNFTLFLVCALWIQRISPSAHCQKGSSSEVYFLHRLLLLGARDAGYASRVKTSHTHPVSNGGVVWPSLGGKGAVQVPLTQEKGGDPLYAQAYPCPMLWQSGSGTFSASIQFVEDLRQTHHMPDRLAADVRNSNQRGVVRDMGTPPTRQIICRSMHQQVLPNYTCRCGWRQFWPLVLPGFLFAHLIHWSLSLSSRHKSAQMLSLNIWHVKLR